MRLGEQTTVKAHGFEFKVACVGSRHMTQANSGDLVSRNVSGPYVLSYQGKYLARLHPAQVKKWARHFALQMLKPLPKVHPAPTVAFYRIRIMYNRDGLWMFAGVDGMVAKAGDAKPYTRVQADAHIKAMSHGYRGERRLEAVPVYQ